MHPTGLEERQKHMSVEAKKLKVFVDVSLSFSSCARLLRVSASFSRSLPHLGSASFHWCSYMAIRWI
jgi:hypothetical protein